MGGEGVERQKTFPWLLNFLPTFFLFLRRFSYPELKTVKMESYAWRGEDTRLRKGFSERTLLSIMIIISVCLPVYKLHEYHLI